MRPVFDDSNDDFSTEDSLQDIESLDDISEEEIEDDIQEEDDISADVMDIEDR